VFGHSERNFIAKVLGAASEGAPLRFVTDEIAAPTSAADLAAAVRAVLEREAPPGIYHLANEGQASRHEWASAIVEAAGLNATVEPITTAQLRAGGYDGPKKPPFSVLANNRARALGITLRPWREALGAFLAPSGAAARG
jgi:dTDP-4-dehydrorhamnose reductase